MPYLWNMAQDDGCVWLRHCTSLAANSVSWGLLPGIPFILGAGGSCVQNLGSPRLLAFFMGLLFAGGCPCVDHPECLAGRVSRVGAALGGERAGLGGLRLGQPNWTVPWIVVLYLFPLIYFSCLFIH